MPDAPATHPYHRPPPNHGAAADPDAAGGIDHREPGSHDVPALSVIRGGRADAPGSQPTVPRQRYGGAGPESTRPLWSALAAARNGCDPEAVRAAESALVGAYRWLQRSLPDPAAADVRSVQAAEAALRKAIRGWQRPQQPWGFEEHARGVIRSEVAQVTQPPVRPRRGPRTHPPRVLDRP